MFWCVNAVPVQVTDVLIIPVLTYTDREPLATYEPRLLATYESEVSTDEHRNFDLSHVES